MELVAVRLSHVPADRPGDDGHGGGGGPGDGGPSDGPSGLGGAALPEGHPVTVPAGPADTRGEPVGVSGRPADSRDQPDAAPVQSEVAPAEPETIPGKPVGHTPALAVRRPPGGKNAEANSGHAARGTGQMTFDRPDSCRETEVTA